MYQTVRNFILTIVFVGLFTLPLLQQLFTLVVEPPLGGSSFRAKMETFNLPGLLSGRYFQSVGNWYAENFGFHKTLVRFENQMNYSVFGDFPCMYQGSIVVGNEHWLFQKELLLNGVQNRYVDRAHTASQIRRLKLLQEQMDRSGVPLLLVIAPLKSSLHPEKIPDKYMVYNNPDNRNFYEQIRPLLDFNGIRYFDSIQTARDLQQEHPDFQIFSPDGTHWTFAFAAYCTEKISQILNPLMQVPFPEFVVDYDRKDQAIWTDKDLRVVSNLTYSKNRENILAYPTISIPDKNLPKPQVAIVGDSYSRTIINMLSGVFGGEYLVESADHYYYFNTFQKYPGPDRVPLDRANFDLSRDILADKDALLIILSEAALFDIGFGFLESVVQ